MSRIELQTIFRFKKEELVPALKERNLCTIGSGNCLRQRLYQYEQRRQKLDKVHGATSEATEDGVPKPVKQFNNTREVGENYTGSASEVTSSHDSNDDGTKITIPQTSSRQMAGEERSNDSGNVTTTQQSITVNGTKVLLPHCEVRLATLDKKVLAQVLKSQKSKNKTTAQQPTNSVSTESQNWSGQVNNNPKSSAEGSHNKTSILQSVNNTKSPKKNSQGLQNETAQQPANNCTMSPKLSRKETTPQKPVNNISSKSPKQSHKGSQNRIVTQQPANNMDTKSQQSPTVSDGKLVQQPKCDSSADETSKVHSQDGRKPKRPKQATSNRSPPRLRVRKSQSNDNSAGKQPNGVRQRRLSIVPKRKQEPKPSVQQVIQQLTGNKSMEEALKIFMEVDHKPASRKRALSVQPIHSSSKRLARKTILPVMKSRSSLSKTTNIQQAVSNGDLDVMSHVIQQPTTVVDQSHGNRLSNKINAKPEVRFYESPQQLGSRVSTDPTILQHIGAKRRKSSPKVFPVVKKNTSTSPGVHTNGSPDEIRVRSPGSRGLKSFTQRTSIEPIPGSENSSTLSAEQSSSINLTNETTISNKGANSKSPDVPRKTRCVYMDDEVSIQQPSDCGSKNATILQKSIPNKNIKVLSPAVGGNILTRQLQGKCSGDETVSILWQDQFKFRARQKRSVTSTTGNNAEKVLSNDGTNVLSPAAVCQGINGKVLTQTNSTNLIGAKHQKSSAQFATKSITQKPNIDSLADETRRSGIRDRSKSVGETESLVQQLNGNGSVDETRRIGTRNRSKSASERESLQQQNGNSTQNQHKITSKSAKLSVHAQDHCESVHEKKLLVLQPNEDGSKHDTLRTYARDPCKSVPRGKSSVQQASNDSPVNETRRVRTLNRHDQKESAEQQNNNSSGNEALTMGARHRKVQSLSNINSVDKAFEVDKEDHHKSVAESKLLEQQAMKNSSVNGTVKFSPRDPRKLAAKGNSLIQPTSNNCSVNETGKTDMQDYKSDQRKSLLKKSRSDSSIDDTPQNHCKFLPPKKSFRQRLINSSVHESSQIGTEDHNKLAKQPSGNSSINEATTQQKISINDVKKISATEASPVVMNDQLPAKSNSSHRKQSAGQQLDSDSLEMQHSRKSVIQGPDSNTLGNKANIPRNNDSTIALPSSNLLSEPQPKTSEVKMTTTPPTKSSASLSPDSTKLSQQQSTSDDENITAEPDSTDRSSQDYSHADILETSADDWQSSKIGLKERFAFLFESKAFSDVVFIVSKGQKSHCILAHKLVLSAGSSVFAAMFQKPITEFKIVGVDPAAFFEFLRYLYTDSLAVSIESVTTILFASKRFNVPHLEKMCLDYYESNLSPTNVLDLLSQAKFFNLQKLIDACFALIDLNTVAVLKSSEFLNIDLETLCSILTRDSLKCSETKLFNAICRWSEAECKRKQLPVNPANQSTVLGEALQLIRYPLMSRAEFLAKVVQSKLLPKDDVMAVFSYLLLNPKPSINFSTKPRIWSLNVPQPVVKSETEELVIE